jgi:hypothetical protein
MLKTRFTKQGAHFDSSNITERPLEPKLLRSTTHQEPPKVVVHELRLRSPV